MKLYKRGAHGFKKNSLVVNGEFRIENFARRLGVVAPIVQTGMNDYPRDPRRALGPPGVPAPGQEKIRA